MSDLTGKFTTLEEQLAAQNTAIAGYIDTVEAKLALIATNLETLNNNGATNTKYLLAALGALDPCKECPQPSLDIPPVSGVLTPPVDEQCKRVQALLHAIQAIAAKFDILNNFGVGFNPTMLTTAFNEIIAGLGEPSTVPLPSWAEMAQMASQALAYATANFTTGTALTEYLAPLYFDLRAAIYATGNPEAGQAAYRSVIGSSDIPYGANGLLQAIGYNDLFSYYLDPASDINLAGYDGAACGAPSECVTLLESESFTMEKTDSDGNNFVWYVLPSWAASIQWDVTFAPSLNVIWTNVQPVEGSPLTGILDATGFAGNSTATWVHSPGVPSYFVVGGFYAGLPNGSTVDVVINSLIVCPAEIG